MIGNVIENKAPVQYLLVEKDIVKKEGIYEREDGAIFVVISKYQEKDIPVGISFYKNGMIFSWYPELNSESRYRKLENVSVEIKS